MPQEIDVDETLKEYGYSRGKSGGMAGYIVLSLFLLAATAGAAFLGKMWSDEKSKLLKAEQSFQRLSRTLSEMETRNSELSSLLADKQAEVERIKEEWSNQVEDMERDHKEQLQRTYAQMNEIVYDSKKTLTYINDIETRLRDGQAIDREEAKKLVSVVNGLSFLHEQYKKPMSEFRELDRYFKKQLDAIPRGSVSGSSGDNSPQVTVTRTDPAETTGVFKRIFNNKKFREEREAYVQEVGRVQGMAIGRETGRREGKREALTQAQQVVAQAYSRAQGQMNQLALDNNKYLAQLEQLVNSNNQSIADVEEFFTKSKEILKIHGEIMSVEPTKVDSIKP